MKRILTRKDYREHRNRAFPRLPKDGGKPWTKRDRDMAADLATVNTNLIHNPETGWQEFVKDTPAWIIRLSARRGWGTHKGNLSFKNK